MMRKTLLLSALVLLFTTAYSQVDTTFIYNTNVPYGSLDVRIAKSPTRYYYLEEGSTFSYRESSPGVKTNTFRDMTAWDSSPYTEGHLREQNGDASEFVMNYRLLKPIGYNESYDKGYPLIVMFHGSGEKGNCWNTNCYHADKSYNPVTNDPPAPTDPEHELLNNDHNLLHGGKVYLDAVNRAGERLPDDPTLEENAYSGFVLFPQNLNGWAPNSVQDAIRIIRLLVKKYNIAEDRIYIHGLSNGGYGVYEALKRVPWMFTSAIVMSAVSDGFITNVGLESEISNIKLWLFQGALDSNPLPQKTRRYVKRFEAAGVQVRYTEYPDVGHTVWNRAYKEPDFFTWFLGQRKATIHSFSGSTTICEGQGLLLEMSKGFLAYQWEKDGQIIEGADSASYLATTPGTYRARFSRVSDQPSEQEWNEWTPGVELTTQPQPESKIRQIGTVLLKDLNNGANALLEADGDYLRYYWYKDGEPLDLPGDQDDTLKSVVLTPGTCSPTCSGNGVYTLITAGAGNCRSAESEPKYVFFNDQAPVNLTAPTGFTGAGDAGTVSLQWSDNATGEGGYEIWRRLKNSETNFSPWEMVALTAADAASYQDTGLQPQKTYQYKIRAVGNSGRSEYTPSETNGVEVTTVPDTNPPGSPQNLVAQRTGIQKVRLTWAAATDDVGIANYQITYEGGVVETGTADTSIVITDLAVDSIYNFSVKALDYSGNAGEPGSTVQVATLVNGLFYEHSPGSWPTLDSIDWSRPEYNGFVSNFTLSPKTQEDYFNFRFDGFIYITSEGDYQFRVTSDDGSRLYMNGELIVDNDGIHELTTAESSAIFLAAGANRIQVDFFEYFKTDSVGVEYAGPDTGGEWMFIPDEVLRSNVVIATENEVANGLKVDVFPNPAAQHELRVQVESSSLQPVRIYLIDAVGRIFAEHIITKGDRQDVISLEPQLKLNNGLYFLNAVQGSLRNIQKVIIQN